MVAAAMFAIGKAGDVGEILTVSEVADRLRLSENTIQRMCDEGDFDGVFKAGDRQWRVPAASVEAYIARRQADQEGRRG
jgi:excisionase family DNA binding protein